jgi:hypothetical protein
MYCRAGQQTEEEMYNNEEGGPAFNEFLDIIGQRVRLKGFNKYKAGLCNKSKSAGQLLVALCLEKTFRVDTFFYVQFFWEER